MAAVGGGGMPGGLSAKQQKLFELRMRVVRAWCPRQGQCVETVVLSQVDVWD